MGRDIRLLAGIGLGLALVGGTGCASMKRSDTSRTGIEQLLISSAIDRSLEKVDMRPIAGAKVFVDTQYLDCVDKNYVILALQKKLMANQCVLAAKAEEADVVLAIGSGGVGTDRNELFVGIPEIPLPPPSPVSVPKMPLFERTKAMGTAKLAILATDTRTKLPVINSGYSLARADHNDWQVMALGGQQSGSVHQELVAQTGETKSVSDFSAVAQAPSSIQR